VTIGCFNINGLNGNDGRGQLEAIIELMRIRMINIMALQETHEKLGKLIQPSAAYTWYGELSHGTTKGGGFGFLVDMAAEPHFKYLGTRGPSSQYGATWAYLKGATRAEDIYIGCTYLPHAKIANAIIEDAHARLQQDISHYQQKPGRVMILGDCNAKVGQDVVASDAGQPPRGPTGKLPEPPQGSNRRNTAASTHNNYAGSLLMNTCDEQDLYFLTGRAPSQTPTCRDSTMVDHIIGPQSLLAWTHTVTHIPSTEADVQCCGSDHTPVTITLPLRATSEKPISTTRLSWRLDNLQKPASHTAYLSAIQDHAHIFENAKRHALHANTLTQEGLNSVTSALLDVIGEAAQASIGQRRIRPGVSKPWMTPELRRTLDTKHQVHAAWRRDPQPATAAAVIAADAKAKTELREAHRKHAKTQASNVNKICKEAPGSHMAFNALKRLTANGKPKERIQALKDKHGSLQTDTPGQLEALRAHYEALATPTMPAADIHPDVALHHEHIKQTYQNILAQPPVDDADTAAKPINAAISKEEVAKAIQKLKNYKAAGHDRVPAELLKRGGSSMLNMLTDLFNMVWDNELVPKGWRQGNVTSIFKAGDRTDCNNYRPITVLPVIDKLFASVLTKRLDAAVALHDHQFAFRANRSTTDPLYIMDNISKQRKHAGLRTHKFFLDMRKAYDRVWHAGLFCKLHKKGVTGKLWRIIHRLYDCSASTPIIDGQTTEPYAILQGVAQGCPMSPVLFDIFIDDLLDELHAMRADGVAITTALDRLVSVSFADDLTASAATRAGLQRIINVIKRHSEKWLWDANVLKSMIMIENPTGQPGDATTANFDPDNQAPDVYMWGHLELPHVTSTKSLGLIVTDDCTWTKQCAHAAKRGHAAVHAMQHVLKNRRLHLATRLACININIKPCMTYGMEVWAPPERGAAAAWAKIERPLRKAVRMTLAVPRGIQNKQYASDILHLDTGIRPLRSDKDAAHLRYYHRLRCLPDTHAQRRTLNAISEKPANPWMRGVRAALADIITPSADDALIKTFAGAPPMVEATPGAPEVRAPKINDALNTAVCKRDTRAAIGKAHYRTGTQASNLHITALSQCTRRRQAYLAHSDYKSMLLLRSGTLPRDAGTEFEATGMCDSEEPPYTRCPDCDCVINPEHAGTNVDQRQDALTMHRLTCCEPASQINDWYHACMLTIVPTEPMCAAIASARNLRHMSDVWAAAQDPGEDPHTRDQFLTPLVLRPCQPYMDLMLSPSAHCKRSDAQQIAAAHQVHSIYLEFDPTTGTMDGLPTPASFGPLPWKLVRPANTPDPDPADTPLFWSYLDQKPLPVPHPAHGGDGRDAEAPPGVGGGRLRRSARRAS
jgi:endonuclease/exonuclease/phosphatase family metal-dependent hydrolase